MTQAEVRGPVSGIGSLRCLHAIDATRFHQTRSWVVSFSILRSFGPRRETRHSTRPHAGHRDAASPGRRRPGVDVSGLVEARGGEPGLLFELRRPFETEGPNCRVQLFSGAADSLITEADAGAAAAGPDGLIDTTTIDAPVRLFVVTKNT